MEHFWHRGQMLGLDVIIHEPMSGTMEELKALVQERRRQLVVLCQSSTMKTADRFLVTRAFSRVALPCHRLITIQIDRGMQRSWTTVLSHLHDLERAKVPEPAEPYGALAGVPQLVSDQPTAELRPPHRLSSLSVPSRPVEERSGRMVALPVAAMLTPGPRAPYAYVNASALD